MDEPLDDLCLADGHRPGGGTRVHRRVRGRDTRDRQFAIRPPEPQLRRTGLDGRERHTSSRQVDLEARDVETADPEPIHTLRAQGHILRREPPDDSSLEIATAARLVVFRMHGHEPTQIAHRLIVGEAEDAAHIEVGRLEADANAPGVPRGPQATRQGQTASIESSPRPYGRPTSIRARRSHQLELAQPEERPDPGARLE
jgi:hypothetical protein